MSLPIPPKGATATETVCQFCNVGCGYTAYTWPVGEEGGPAPTDNAFGVDLRAPQPALGFPYGPTMADTIEGRDGVRRHVAIVPAVSDVNRNRDHSARGAIAAKTTYDRRRRTGERLTHPLLRVGDALVRVTWEEALDVVARVLVGVRDAHGADAICAKAFDHGGGGGGFENNWAVGKLLFTGIGTQNVGIHNRPAYNSEVWGSRDRGLHELHSTMEDVRLCDTLVLWGANSYETATVLVTEHALPNFQGLTAAEKRAAFGAEEVPPLRVVVVDPRRTATVGAFASLDADRVLHLRPAPGTDVVLADALARIVWDRRWHDPGMVRDRSDAATWKDYADRSLRLGEPLGKVLDEAARTTGIPKVELLRAAEWMSGPKRGKARRRTLTLYEKGVIWNQRNYDTVAAVAQLSVLGGHVGRPGTGCSRQGGHQEGYVRPGYPGPRPPPNVDQHLVDGGGKVLWVMGTNPYLTTPRAQQYRRAIHRRTVALTGGVGAERGGEPATPEARAAAIVAALAQGDGLFLVISELYLTDTARDAHVVLPAAGWGEADLTSINCNSRLLRLYGAFMDPPGAAIPDWEICARTARRVEALYLAAGKRDDAARFAGFDWTTAEQVFLEGGAAFPDNRVDEAGAEQLPVETYTGVTYAKLREVGQTGIQTPVRRDPATGEIVGTKRRFGLRFGTPDGKFRWHGSDPWSGWPEPVARYLQEPARWPFWLTTGRTQRLWQTGYHDQRVPERIAEEELPFVELHPDDARPLGVATGDLVEVWNEEGNLVAQARVFDGPPPGLVFALQFHPGGTANDLTSAYTDPKTTIPWYKGTRVAVRKLDGDVSEARDRVSRLATHTFR